MPPKKRKRQSRKTTQSQRQSQKVIVNIGSKSAPRKKSGRGGLPPPSHMHNLAPTFVTSPQIDYTPILAMLTHQTRSLQPEPLRNPVTPLSSVTQALPAEQMAGEAAIRRAGPTAGNFQPPPSRAQARDTFGFPEPIVKSTETLKQEFAYLAQQASLKGRASQAQEQAEEAIKMVQQALRPPDPYVTQTLLPTKSAEDLGPDYAGGGLATAETRRARGRPKKGTQVATPVGQPPIQAEKKIPSLGDIRPFLKSKK